MYCKVASLYDYIKQLVIFRAVRVHNRMERLDRGKKADKNKK